MTNKFELTTESIAIGDITLYRIIALKSFGAVKKGDLGGFVQTEYNLSQEGNAWVFDGGKVYDNAAVWGDAIVCDKARVYGKATVFDNAMVSGEAKVFGVATVYGYDMVYGRTILGSGYNAE